VENENKSSEWRVDLDDEHTENIENKHLEIIKLTNCGRGGSEARRSGSEENERWNIWMALIGSLSSVFIEN
jgi:hypothetical protein